jgi:hypothetical protein
VTPRVQKEIELLKTKFPNLEFKEERNRTIIIFHDYPLPPGWPTKTTNLAIVIPPGYPITPPDNFYVQPPILTASGATPGSYNLDGTSNGMPGWAWFSFHMRDAENRPTWSPSDDVASGDNIMTFLRAVNDRLREAN